MVFPPRCVGLGRIAQGGHGIRTSLCGLLEDSPGSTLKGWDSGEVHRLGRYHLQSSVLWVGDLQPLWGQILILWLKSAWASGETEAVFQQKMLPIPPSLARGHFQAAG